MIYYGEKKEKDMPTIIKVRRGINGFKYSACDKDGYFLGNFEKLGDVRKYWKREINLRYIVLVRELNKYPDMTKLDAMQKAMHELIFMYTKKGKKKTPKPKDSGDPT